MRSKSEFCRPASANANCQRNAGRGAANARLRRTGGGSTALAISRRSPSRLPSMFLVASGGRDVGAYLGLVPRRYQSGEVDYTGSIWKLRRSTDANPALRSGERHADALQRSAEAEGLGAGDRGAVHDAKGADCSRPAAGHHHARDAAARHRVQTGVADRQRTEQRPKRAPERSDAEGGNDDGFNSVACGRSDRPTAISTKPLHTPGIQASRQNDRPLPASVTKTTHGDGIHFDNGRHYR